MVTLRLKDLIDGMGITRYELAKRTGIRFHIIDNYYKNKVVRYDSDILNKLCQALDCDIVDLIEYTKDPLK
ncbi:MAG: helix-turn-helix transcriptional regulator [Clostridia bacterium]|nr:helix-turn-helix transcriptional regulator [Clostridia bacterium]